MTFIGGIVVFCYKPIFSLKIKDMPKYRCKLKTGSSTAENLQSNFKGHLTDKQSNSAEKNYKELLPTYRN